MNEWMKGAVVDRSVNWLVIAQRTRTYSIPNKIFGILYSSPNNFGIHPTFSSNESVLSQQRRVQCKIYHLYPLPPRPYTLSWVLFRHRDKIYQYNKKMAGPNGCAVWGTYCLRPLENWDRGLESRSKLRCVWVFLCCVIQCKLRPCVGLIPRPRSPTKRSNRFINFRS